MKSLHLAFLSCLLILAPAISAQTGINLGGGADQANTNLPLRNLQIEVRQVDQGASGREQLDAAITARVQPGQSAAAIGLEARGTQGAHTSTAQQMVLVLNGRRAAIALGNAVPLRLMQARLRNGVWVAVPGAVWLQAGTGFDATARWDGGSLVELGLVATQARNPPRDQLAPPTSAASTLVMLPLGEWVTVAESDQDLDQQQNSLGGYGRTTGQSQLRVQVRLTVR